MISAGSTSRHRIGSVRRPRPTRRCSFGVHLHPDNAATGRARGARRRQRRPRMKPSLLIVAVVLVAGSGLAIMNNACKSGHHTWCAPISNIRHHVKTGHSQQLRTGKAVHACRRRYAGSRDVSDDLPDKSPAQRCGRLPRYLRQQTPERRTAVGAPVYKERHAGIAQRRGQAVEQTAL